MSEPARYRVLFVDDEQSILDGLRDVLRKQRKHWDIVFALGGAAALRELEAAHFDVVVSDMRMPQMDGAMLLAVVKDRYPACARIILSGHAERESVVKALPVAHQFLHKPCDGELLRVVVQRACELQRLLQDEGIRSIVGRLDKLPSVPHTYWELTQAAARPEVTLNELARIVELDPAMSVKVLQLVNSSYFGIAQPLSSVQAAVSYLGIEVLRALALVVHAFSAATGELVPGFTIEDVQRHGTMAARLGRRMGGDTKLAGEVFTACVIHDVGKLILALGMPERYGQVVQEVRASGRSFHDVEREHLGLSHAEVGAFLLGYWGLPLSIVEAVAFHHTPSLVQGGDLAVLARVHVADALIAAAMLKTSTSADASELDLPFVERVGLLAQLPQWKQLAEEIVASQSAS